MTAVTDRPTDVDRPPQRNRTLIAALVGLVLVALVVVAAVVSSNRNEAGSELPEEVAQVVDDYRNAWMNQDIEAFYASITDDFFFRTYYYGSETHTLWETWVQDAGTPSRAAFALEFEDPIELVEVRDVLVSGDGPWIVTANEIWESHNGFRYRWDGNFTRVVVEDEGRMKIASEVFAGTITEAGE